MPPREAPRLTGGVFVSANHLFHVGMNADLEAVARAYRATRRTGAQLNMLFDGVLRHALGAARNA